MADTELSEGIDAINNARFHSETILERCDRMDRHAISAFEFHPDNNQWHIRFKPKHDDETTRMLPAGIASRMPELIRSLGFEKVAADNVKNTGPTFSYLIKKAFSESFIVLLMVTAFAVVLFFLATGDQKVDPNTVWRKDKRAILELSRIIEPHDIVLGFSLINLCIFAWFLTRVTRKAKDKHDDRDQSAHTLYEPTK